MKAVVLTLFATLALGGLLGCHNRQNAQQPPPLEPMQQSYTGLLPCGPACEDSESSLFLATDGSYVLEQRATGEHTLRSAQRAVWPVGPHRRYADPGRHERRETTISPD